MDWPWPPDITKMSQKCVFAVGVQTFLTKKRGYGQIASPKYAPGHSDKALLVFTLIADNFDIFFITNDPNIFSPWFFLLLFNTPACCCHQFNPFFEEKNKHWVLIKLFLKYLLLQVATILNIKSEKKNLPFSKTDSAIVEWWSCILILCNAENSSVS